MRVSVSGYVRQCVTAGESRARRARAWAAWGLVATCASAFVALVLFAPVARARGVWSSAIVYAAFGLICHQIPGRSFHVEGHPLAVCARCFGVYAGFACVAFLYPLLVRSVERVDAPGRAWLLAAAMPLAFDFTLGFTGLWENTHLSRVATGALVGAAAVFYVVPGAVELSRRDLARRVFADASDDSQTTTPPRAMDFARRER